MKRTIVLASVAGLALGFVAIAVSVVSGAPHLAFRIVACVLLIDQAALTLLAARLPIAIRSVSIALRIGSVLAIAAGALLLVWSAFPHEGPPEIAMPAVGIAMIAHAALTLRYLGTVARSETP